MTSAGRCGFPVVPPKAQRKGSHADGLSTITAPPVGMQISPRLYPEVSPQALVCRAAERLGIRVSGPRPAERRAGGGRAPPARSGPQVGEGPAEGCGRGHCRVAEREECESYGAAVSRQGAELHRRALVGAGLFRVDGRPRRTHGPGVHPGPGAGGPSARSTQVV